MSDKIKLLELAFKNISEDRNFLSFYLLKYLDIEKVSQQEVMKNLNSSLENYYRLGLCRVPDSSSSSYIEQLNKISEHSHVSTLGLNTIIKRVDAILKFSDVTDNSFLMAARDRKAKKEGDKDSH